MCRYQHSCKTAPNAHEELTLLWQWGERRPKRSEGQSSAYCAPSGRYPEPHLWFRRPGAQTGGMDVRTLYREGHSIKQIARQTGHSRNTVRRVLREAGPKGFQQPERPSCLGAFKPYLKERSRAADCPQSVCYRRSRRWDIAPDHLDRLVPGLHHDGALALAGGPSKVVFPVLCVQSLHTTP